MVPHHWSTIPEENQTSDPNGLVQKNWPAKAMGPAVRGLMATAAMARDDAIGASLLARLGAGNVYTITTNEGLIDPATQINGQTPAITKPFLIRVSFDTNLFGTAANPPMLVVDGAVKVPLVKARGDALADADILTGRPYLILGDTIASGAYSRARVLETLPSDIAVPVSAGIPIGGIVPFTGGYVPSGFLEASGVYLGRGDYPALWAHAQASGMITDDAAWVANGYLQGWYSRADGASYFRLPLLRGTFLRALDNGRGLDPGRALGTVQSDAFRAHGHSMANGGAPVTLYGSGPGAGLSYSGGSGYYADSIAAAGGPETRPVNVAYPFLIRAY